MASELGVRFLGLGRVTPRHYLNPVRRYRWLSNAATTAWATATNWDWGIFPPANDTLSDVAVFDQTSYVSQPNAGTASILGIYTAPVSASFTLSGTALTLGGANVMSSGSNTTTISCPLAGITSVIHDGSGTLALSGANTYSGGTTIRAGTIAGSNASAFGSGGISLGDSRGSASATLTLGGNALTYANAITIATGSSGTKTIAGPGAGNVSATITGGIASGPGFTFDIKGATLVTSTAATTGSGPITVLNSTVGTQTNEFVNLNVASSGYTGVVTISSSGNVRVSAANALSQASSISVASGGILQAAVGTLNCQGLNDSGGSGGSVSCVSGARTISLNGSSGSFSFSGVISNGGGTTALTKSGASTQILGGANTYTGATTLSSTTGGTLQINGSLGATAVSWGASGNTTLAAPSSGSGTAALGSTLTGIATSRWSFPSTATTFSKFTVAGATTFAGGFVDFPAGITTNGTYDLIVSTGAMTGTLPAVGTNSTGKTLVLSQVGNTLQVTVS